jgi:hypothetical protein
VVASRRSNSKDVVSRSIGDRSGKFLMSPKSHRGDLKLDHHLGGNVGFKFFEI